MIGKRVENIEEIRADIKVSTKLGHSIIQIFTESGEVFGLIKYLIRQFVGKERNF